MILAFAVAGVVVAGFLLAALVIRSTGGLMITNRPSFRHITALRRGAAVPGRYLWRIRPRRRRRQR